MFKLITLLFLFCVASCGLDSSSSLKEAINQVNDPIRIPGASSILMYNFNKLPEQGSVSRLWDYGWWWPASEGGTASTRFGNPSPMKKYDLATGSHAYPWEVASSKQVAHVGWAGHCNGLSAARIMMEEPIKSVEYNSVTFSTHDIKALVTEMWQGSGYIIGDRCDRSRITFDNYGRIRETECRDINPGTFHLAITNYIGLFGKSLVTDADPSSAVWNYAISDFAILQKKWLTHSEAAQKIHITSSSYVFNEKAVDLVLLHMQVTFHAYATKVYEYILELDQKGYILGGEWLGMSKQDHPDFLWRPDDPKPENPYLDMNIVMDIYRKSI